MRKDEQNTPIGLIGFTQHFSDEKTCLRHLEQIRWNGNPVCPYCGCTKYHSLPDEKRYRCYKCRRNYNVKIGTIFHKTRLSLPIWFTAIRLLSSTKGGVSSYYLMRELLITQKTAWFLLHRIRKMMTPQGEIRLFNQVEVDETFFGGKLKNKHAKQRRNLLQKGRGAVHKTPVMGLYQRNGRVYTEVISGTGGEVLKPIVRKYVDEKSTLITDAWKGYNGLNEYHHEVINHHQGEYVREKYHTNSIEGFWSQIKRGVLGVYRVVTPKHLQRYCHEFSFRYNTRNVGNLGRVNQVLYQSECRLTYQELIHTPVIRRNYLEEGINWWNK